MDECGLCHRDSARVETCYEEKVLVYSALEERPAIPAAPAGLECPGCGVLPGKIHHPFCPEERCPRCDGRVRVCECEPIHGYYPEDDPDDEDTDELRLEFVCAPPEVLKERERESTPESAEN